MTEKEKNLVDRLAGLIAHYADAETIHGLTVVANEACADYDVECQGKKSWKEFWISYFHGKELPPKNDPEWNTVEKLYDEYCEDYEKNQIPILDNLCSDAELLNDFVKRIKEKVEPKS